LYKLFITCVGKYLQTSDPDTDRPRFVVSRRDLHLGVSARPLQQVAWLPQVIGRQTRCSQCFSPTLQLVDPRAAKYPRRSHTATSAAFVAPRSYCADSDKATRIAWEAFFPFVTPAREARRKRRENGYLLLDQDPQSLRSRIPQHCSNLRAG